MRVRARSLTVLVVICMVALLVAIFWGDWVGEQPSREATQGEPAIAPITSFDDEPRYRG
jgi:hypothetical protein